MDMTNLCSGLIGALIGAIAGFFAAMWSTRHAEQVAALTDFKRRLLDYIRRIEKEKGSGNSSLDTIRACMADMKSVLRKFFNSYQSLFDTDYKTVRAAEAIKYTACASYLFNNQFASIN